MADLREHLFHYKSGGKTFTLSVKAESAEDAEQALAGAVYDGELVLRIDPDEIKSRVRNLVKDALGGGR